MYRLTVLLPLVFLGCDAAGTDSADTAGGDTDTDTDPDTATDVDINAPVVTITGVSCANNVDAEPTWVVDGTATDPQGEDDISSLDNYAAIVQGDTEGDPHAAAFGNGTLIASWTSTEDEESCSLTGTVRLYAMDDDGHLSAPAEWAWPTE